MITKNRSGWTLLEFLKIAEHEISNYENVTGAFAIINVNGKFLIGYNSLRRQWEFPAGGIEKGETARAAAKRELFEETHQKCENLKFKGLFKISSPNGETKYQAVFSGLIDNLLPFEKCATDEMDEIKLWDLKEDIGYVDECDLKMVEMSCL